MRLTTLQQKVKPQPWKASTIKVKALIGEEWDPVTWNWDMWKDPMESEKFEPSDLKDLSHLGKYRIVVEKGSDNKVT